MTGKLLTPANLITAAGYLLVVGSIAATMITSRRHLIAQHTTPQAQQAWEKWRSEAASESPVQRRTPKSPEPNVLVLMRDHFATCLTAALFFSSLVYLLFAGLLRGAIRNQRQRRAAAERESRIW